MPESFPVRNVLLLLDVVFVPMKSKKKQFLQLKMSMGNLESTCSVAGRFIGKLATCVITSLQSKTLASQGHFATSLNEGLIQIIVFQYALVGGFTRTWAFPLISGVAQQRSVITGSLFSVWPVEGHPG